MHKATEQMVIGNDRDTLKKINAERAVSAARSESANRLHETTMARERQDMLVPCVLYHYAFFSCFFQIFMLNIASRCDRHPQ